MSVESTTSHQANRKPLQHVCDLSNEESVRRRRNLMRLRLACDFSLGGICLSYSLSTANLQQIGLMDPEHMGLATLQE